MNVSALYVDPKGHYPKLLSDVWDEKRDARFYAGQNPIVAHPPCSAWCAFAKLNEARWGAKVGDDGHCFARALHDVRKWGGVLEHPAQSLAWDAFGLIVPTRIGWQQVGPYEWVCEVWQSAYGHPATKRTWLYYVGFRAPFDLNWERRKGAAQVGAFPRQTKKRRLTAREAKSTPILFARTLIALAEHSR